MKTLETERLILRTFEESDAADVFAYAQNPNVGPPAGWPPHADIEESQRIIRMFIQADDCWAIVDRKTGHVIGSLGIHQDGKRNHPGARSIGYVLGEPHWGQGLMPEAVQAVLRFCFEEMGLKIISAFYFPFNTQSRRVMEKCGMKHEGTLRMCTRIFSGEIYDDVCYSITQEEWKALNP